MIELIKSIWRITSRILPDKVYISLEFKKHIGYFPNLKNPKTFSEKLQWLKLHDKKPVYTTMVDKYEAKKYVGSIIGEEYIIPSLGVWNHFDEIDFDLLPDRFVLKCTHDSAGIFIVKNKAELDKKKVKKKIEACLKNNFFYSGREWPYKNVKPRIIAEKFMEDDRISILKRSNYFSFDGISKALHIEEKVSLKSIDHKHLSNQRQQLLEKLNNEASKVFHVLPNIQAEYYESGENAFFADVTFDQKLESVLVEKISQDSVFRSWTEVPEAYGGGYTIFDNGYAIWLHHKENAELVDYKFYCFNGEPKFLYIAQSNFDAQGNKHDKLSFKDLEWNDTPFGRADHEPLSQSLVKPEKFSEMIKIARKLSENLMFCRVDLYYINNKVYFSEITFYPGSGFGAFSPEEWERKIGDWINIPCLK